MTKNTETTWNDLLDNFFLAGGMDTETFRRTVGISRRTLRRWQTGATRIPRAAYLAAQLIGGEIGATSPAWRGWRLLRGALVDPGGQEHTPASIAAWHWTAAQLQGARARENQETPADLPANVAPFPTRRRAHRLTAATLQQLENGDTSP